MAKRASSNRDELHAELHGKTRKHDPADFIVPAKDTKGESVRVWCRVQPAHDRAVSTIFYSRKFPFKTPSDILRWCIHTGLKRLEVMEDVPSVTQQVEAMMVILRDEEFHQEFQGFLQHAQAVINRHIADGAHGEARRVVAMLRTKVAGMPDGYWKKKYQRTIETQFSHLLSAQSAGKIKLMPRVRAEQDDDDDEEN